MHRIWEIARWVFLGFVLLYVAVVIYAYPHDHEAHLSAAMVAKIQAQRITPADIDGQYLPPPPDRAKVNATIAGIDANDNGIRDDVELAIFAEYPTSTATRAAELQYAMTEQMFLTDVFDQNTWKAVADQDDRAYQCVAAHSAETDIVEALVVNTPERQQKFDEVFSSFETSFGLPSGAVCDIGLPGSSQ